MIRTLNNEYLLQYIWKYRLIPQNGIVTTDGNSLTIVKQGEINAHNGPDFLNAEIEIDGQKWYGHIEIHLNASDWIAHKHIGDLLYENVILHVVLNNDCTIYRKDGSIIPTLDVRKLMPKNFTSTYLALIYNSKNIPCANLQYQIPQLHFKKWLETLAIQRIEDKTMRFFDILNSKNDDWDEAIYTYLSIAFGGSLNQESFEQLTHKLPLKLLRRHIFNLRELSILILDTAGFYEKLKGDESDRMLDSDIDHYRKMYNIELIRKEQWVTKGLRPPNQPFVKLKQFAHFLHMKQNFLSDWLEMRTLNQFANYFSPQHISQNDKPGKETINILIINAVVPVLYSYGMHSQLPIYNERALDLLQEIYPETNSITKMWKSLGRKPDSALDSQGMIQLSKKYCIHKKCDQCAVGYSLLKKSELEDKEIIYQRSRSTT